MKRDYKPSIRQNRQDWHSPIQIKTGFSKIQKISFLILGLILLTAIASAAFVLKSHHITPIKPPEKIQIPLTVPTTPK